MTKYDGFIASIKTYNTQKVVKSLSDIGKYDYSNCTMIDIEQVILNMKPNSPKAITTICYVMTLYATYLQNNNMLQMVKSIDRTSLWAMAKPAASQKFISYFDYQNIYRDIEKYEMYNSSYYKALFRSIYEGIYNSDLSVIKNLRYSDCISDRITLHDDNGATYDLEVSKDLIKLLKELSNINTWERNTRHGNSVEITIVGKYEDSCFKTENRGGSEKVFRYAYYRMLRKIFVEYLGCNITPQAVFVSGIMYRIKGKLNENGITLTEAFKKDNKNKMVSSIIANELKMSNYNISVRNFREIVSGSLDVFEK